VQPRLPVDVSHIDRQDNFMQLSSPEFAKSPKR
jgi:hypothetical protein